VRVPLRAAIDVLTRAAEMLRPASARLVSRLEPFGARLRPYYATVVQICVAKSAPLRERWAACRIWAEGPRRRILALYEVVTDPQRLSQTLLALLRRRVVAWSLVGILLASPVLGYVLWLSHCLAGNTAMVTTETTQELRHPILRHIAVAKSAAAHHAPHAHATNTPPAGDASAPVTPPPVMPETPSFSALHLSDIEDARQNELPPKGRHTAAPLVLPKGLRLDGPLQKINLPPVMETATNAPSEAPSNAPQSPTSATAGKGSGSGSGVGAPGTGSSGSGDSSGGSASGSSSSGGGSSGTGSSGGGSSGTGSGGATAGGSGSAASAAKDDADEQDDSQDSESDEPDTPTVAAFALKHEDSASSDDAFSEHLPADAHRQRREIEREVHELCAVHGAPMLLWRYQQGYLLCVNRIAGGSITTLLTAQPTGFLLIGAIPGHVSAAQLQHLGVPPVIVGRLLRTATSVAGGS